MIKTYFIQALIMPILFCIGWVVRFIFYYGIKELEGFHKFDNENYPKPKFDIWYVIFYVILFWPLNIMDTYIMMQERVDAYHQSMEGTK